MTPIPAHAGSTATQQRSRLLSVILAVIVLLGLSTPAHASTPTPSPTLSGEAQLSLAAADNGLMAPGDPLSVLVSLANGTSTRIPGVAATVYIGDAPIADRSSLTAWSSSSDVPAGRAIGALAIDETASGQTTTASFVLPGDDEAIATRAAGIYPLWVDAGAFSARSTIAIGVQGTGSVGVIVPIVAGPSERGLLTAARLEALTAPQGALTARLDAVEGTSAILAIDPAVVAAVRVLGSSAPESAREWLTRLTALPNQRFALQFGDADVAAQIAAGLASPLQPTALTAYLDESASVAPTPSPGATASPADPAAPTLDELLDVGATIEPPIYWPIEGTASPQLTAALHTATPGALTLVSSVDTTAPDGSTVIARGALGDAGVLVADSTAADALRAAASTADPVARDAALASASAQLVMASIEAGGAPLLVTVGRESAVDAAGLRAAVTSVGALPGVSAVTLTGIVASPPSPVELDEGTVDAARSDAVTSLLAGAEQIELFATVLDDPSLLTGTERASSLHMLGAAWVVDDADWVTAMADHRAATTATLNAVDIVPSSALNLLTAGTNLRFWIRNDLPYPVNVVLIAAPDDLRVDIDRETPVTAAPAANTAVEVPVNARIGNGDVRIDLSLRSPALVPVGSTQTVDVNVRADWEGIGLVTLGILAAGFLIIGVVRTVRRRRRVAARAERDDAPTTDSERNDLS